MANTTHTGSLKTGTQGADQQAAAIGATIGPDGWWYKGGKRLTPQEADALTNAAGVGVTTTDDAHGAKSNGWLTDRVRANESWLKPVAVGLGTVLGTPALGAGIAGAWNYADNHDLGKAALDAGLTYGGGKLLSGVGKAAADIPGVGSTIDAIKNSSIGQAISDAGDSIGGTLKPVGVALQGALNKSGVKLPSAGDVGSFLTGNNGLNALGIAQGLNAAQLGAKSDSYANQAKDIAMQRWNAGAPLRDKGLAGLTNPVPVNLSALDAQRTVGNPFARPVGVGG